jgi:hypothetical protein
VQTENNKSQRGFGNFMGMHSLAADLEVAHQRQQEEPSTGAGSLGRSNSRGSGLNGSEVRGSGQGRGGVDRGEVEWIGEMGSGC